MQVQLLIGMTDSTNSASHLEVLLLLLRFSFRALRHFMLRGFFCKLELCINAAYSSGLPSTVMQTGKTGTYLCAGAPLYTVARVISTGPAGASTPLTFRAHYDDHWAFTTHELVFLLRSAVAEAG